jgi:hypothetical protein
MMLANEGVDPEKNLNDSIQAFTKAVHFYCKDPKYNTQCARILMNMGTTYLVLAQKNVEPLLIIDQSLQALDKATLRFKQDQDWGSYTRARHYRAQAYRQRAANLPLGESSDKSIDSSIEDYREVVKRWCSHETNLSKCANAQFHLAGVYSTRGDRREPTKNLSLAIGLLRKSAKNFQDLGMELESNEAENQIKLNTQRLAAHQSAGKKMP